MSRAIARLARTIESCRDAQRARREPVERESKPQWARHGGLTVVQIDAPDDLSVSARAQYVAEARAAGQFIRAQLIQVGLITPRPKASA